MGAPEVQRLVGAGLAVPVKVFYAQDGYTPAAMAYAERAEVGLFIYSIYGDVEPVGTYATALLVRGQGARDELSAEVDEAEQRVRALGALAGALEESLRQVEAQSPTDTPAVYVCAEIAVQLSTALDMRRELGAVTSEHDALDAEISQAIAEGDPRPSRWIHRLHDWDIRRARILAGDSSDEWVRLAGLLSEMGAVQRWPRSVGANMSYLGWYTWPQKAWVTQEVANRLVQLDPLRKGTKWCQGAMWYVNKSLTAVHADLNIRFYDGMIPNVGGWRQLLELDEPLRSPRGVTNPGALWE